MEEEEGKINQGFDRGISYEEIKNKFTNELDRLYNCIRDISEEDAEKFYKKKNLLIRKAIYLLISMLQLRNGSRISEAIKAFKLFITKKVYLEKVIVKISKSDSIKTNRAGERIKLQARFRKIMFPLEWINKKILKIIEDSDALDEVLNCGKIRHRVFDYLNKNFNCNTHSLRYACINYLLYEKKLEMGIVAKFIGHSNLDQLLRYTQLKNTDAIFDMDI